MSESPTRKHLAEDDLVLVAVPSAISCAQLLVQAVTRDWQLDQRCANATTGAVSEFVAHSVATTGMTDPGPTYHSEFNRLGLITVRLRLMPRSLVVEVWDAGDSPPEPLLAGTFRDDVEDWGYDLPQASQRVVWCTLAARNSKPGDTVRLPSVLPRRERKSFPKPNAPINPMRDPQVLHRILDGLRALGQGTDEEKEC